MSGGKTLILAGVLLVVFVLVSLAIPSEWEGVDVAVVQNQAEGLGADVADPFINITGDLLLFMFTAAGAIGGFIVGYAWRSIFGTPPKEQRVGQREEN